MGGCQGTDPFAQGLSVEAQWELSCLLNMSVSWNLNNVKMPINQEMATIF